jgi:hypothetical protein
VAAAVAFVGGLGEWLPLLNPDMCPTTLFAHACRKKSTSLGVRVVEERTLASFGSIPLSHDDEAETKRIWVGMAQRCDRQRQGNQKGKNHGI